MLIKESKKKGDYMKLIVSANSYDHLSELLKLKIDGILLSIDKLSVNDSFYINKEDLANIDFKGKEVFISLNKLMHNADLPLLRETLAYLKDKNVRIMFYDMAVYMIAREYDMLDKLVIMQDHLNASTLSNNFYEKRGLKGSFITSDITKDELLEIKKHSKMEIFFLGYGYAPIFYSRRYLITNYLKYIKEKNNGTDYKIVSDTNKAYIIDEEAYGTTVYTEEPINLINYLDDLKAIDYLVLKSNKITDQEFNKMVTKFINHNQVENPYIGFFNTKTIYRVK